MRTPTSHGHRPALAFAAAALALLLTAQAVLAQAAATLSVSPTTLSPGDTLTVSGTGWDPNEQVIIESKLAGNTVSTDAQRAGPDGRFSVSSPLPATTPPGLTIMLVATGATSRKTAQAQFNVVARGGAPSGGAAPAPAPAAAPAPAPAPAPAAGPAPAPAAVPRTGDEVLVLARGLAPLAFGGGLLLGGAGYALRRRARP
jgi:hypothetical protein